MIDPVSLRISAGAVTISAGTAWLTLLRPGQLKMTRPTLFYLGPDDPTQQWIDESNSFAPYLVKRLSFDYEREVRLVFQDYPTQGEMLNLSAPSPAGLAFKADLPGIIEAVHIAPEHPQWFASAVTSVVSKYYPGIQVKQSHLDTAPMF